MARVSGFNARFAQVAQSVEQRTENPRVGGSIPPLGTNENNDLRRFPQYRIFPCKHSGRFRPYLALPLTPCRYRAAQVGHDSRGIMGRNLSPRTQQITTIKDSVGGILREYARAKADRPVPLAVHSNRPITHPAAVPLIPLRFPSITLMEGGEWRRSAIIKPGKRFFGARQARRVRVTSVPATACIGVLLSTQPGAPRAFGESPGARYAAHSNRCGLRAGDTVTPRGPQAAITLTAGKASLALSSSVSPAWVAALLMALKA